MAVAVKKRIEDKKGPKGAPLKPKDATITRLPPTAAELEFRTHLDQMLGGLLVDRYSWWTHWQDIAQYLIPRRYKWLITPNQANRGSPINQRIIDSTGTIALRTCTAGLMSGMTNPTTIWFRFTLDDKDLAANYEVKAWLDEAAMRVRTVLAESNFYTSMGALYEDLAAFGTGVMIIYEDFEDVIRCYNSCAGEYFLAQSSRLAVDTMYRTFVRTTRQTAKEFGVENCSPTVQQAMKQKGAALTRELIIAHGIEPNDELTDKMPGLQRRPYREAYWEWGSSMKGLLRVRGFHENPVVAPRWSVFANDAYGRGPGMDALGDIKQLQVQQKRKAQAIDKMVNPPMVADVQLKNEPATLLPGGVTYVQTIGTSGKPGFQPVYEVKPDLSQMVEDIKECQGRIGDVFYKPLFMLFEQMEGVQPRNQLEIMERKGEKLVQLGPMLERFGNEALDVGLERTFAIMTGPNRDYGIGSLLPPPPRILRGHHVKIEYVSMLAQAQKATMTTALEQFASFVGRMAALNPEAADNMDSDDLIQKYADFTGVPVSTVRPMAKVLQMRMARAQEAAKQATIQQTLAGVAGAKTLSETSVGGGRNALEAMIGSGSQ